MRAILPKLLGFAVASLQIFVLISYFERSTTTLVLVPVSFIVGVVVAYIGSVKWAKPVDYFELHPPRAPEEVLRIVDLPEVIGLLNGAPEDSFAGVNVPNSERFGTGQTAFIQFSVEDGRLGVDWVLESRQNKEDRDRFEALARSLGHRAESRERNEVKYVRIEDGDLLALFSTTLRELYRIADDEALAATTTGIEWSSEERAESAERMREILDHLKRIFGDDLAEARKRLERIPLKNTPETLAFLRRVPAGTTMKALPQLRKAFRAEGR